MKVELTALAITIQPFKNKVWWRKKKKDDRNWNSYRSSNVAVAAFFMIAYRWKKKRKKSGVKLSRVKLLAGEKVSKKISKTSKTSKKPLKNFSFFNE